MPTRSALTLKPVMGSVHAGSTFDLPFLSQCSIITITRLRNGQRAADHERRQRNHGVVTTKRVRQANARGGGGGGGRLRGRRDEIHGAAHPFDQLARDQVVGHVAVGRHLHRAKDGHVAMAATNHGERLVSRKVRRASDLRRLGASQ
jgi:hypothetical protein